MPWESYVLSSFQAVPPKDPSRFYFHCSYNKLLYSLFPMDTYTVHPLWKPGPYLSPYFRFDILYKNKTVFILELKAPGYLQYSSKRQEGIRQVQDRLKNLGPECPLPELHAVCAFVTKLCFCKLAHNQSMQPSFMDARPEGTTDLAPEKYWDCDILEEEGAKRFKTIVEEIKRACVAF